MGPSSLHIVGAATGPSEPTSEALSSFYPRGPMAMYSRSKEDHSCLWIAQPCSLLISTSATLPRLLPKFPFSPWCSFH